MASRILPSLNGVVLNSAQRSWYLIHDCSHSSSSLRSASRFSRSRSSRRFCARWRIRSLCAACSSRARRFDSSFSLSLFSFSKRSSQDVLSQGVLPQDVLSQDVLSQDVLSQGVLSPFPHSPGVSALPPASSSKLARSASHIPEIAILDHPYHLAIEPKALISRSCSRSSFIVCSES